MFTSRSEFRLRLRAENSDIRLSQRAIELGLLSDEQVEVYRKKVELMEKAREFLHVFSLPSRIWNKHGVPHTSAKQTDQISAAKLLSFPH